MPAKKTNYVAWRLFVENSIENDGTLCATEIKARVTGNNTLDRSHVLALVGSSCLLQAASEKESK